MRAAYTLKTPAVGAAEYTLNRYTYADAVDMVLLDEELTFLDSTFTGSPTTTARRWQLADHQGSVRDTIAVGESSATMPSHQWVDYDSFGNKVGTGTNGSRYGYTGREVDLDTGLQWNRARWYDPRTGTFINQDPSGFSGGDENLYRYVGNNPPKVKPRRRPDWGR